LEAAAICLELQHPPREEVRRVSHCPAAFGRRMKLPVVAVPREEEGFGDVLSHFGVAKPVTTAPAEGGGFGGRRFYQPVIGRR